MKASFFFQGVSFSPNDKLFSVLFFFFGLFTHLRLFLHKWNIFYMATTVFRRYILALFFAFVSFCLLSLVAFFSWLVYSLGFAFWLFCRQETVIYTFFVLSTKRDTGCPLWFELFIFLRFKQKNLSFFFSFFPMRKYFTFEYAVLLSNDLVCSCFFTCLWLLFLFFLSKKLCSYSHIYSK